MNSKDDTLDIDKNEMVPLASNILSKIPIKMSIFLFLIYIFLSSDIYIDFLETYGFVNQSTRCLKNSAYILNASILIILFILLNMLIQTKVL